MRNWSKNKMTLVLIRHGETKSNREHRYLGRTEESLSEEGERKLAEYQRLGCYPHVDYLFCSPMKRCIQTAGILYPEINPIPILEWEEIDFGLFEGKNYIDLKDNAQYQEWIDSNGKLPFPKGESREQFVLRCKNGFQRMIQLLEKIPELGSGKTIGIVVHGGTIMALLSSYGDGDYYDFQTANGKGYICTWEYMGDEIKFTDYRQL